MWLLKESVAKQIEEAKAKALSVGKPEAFGLFDEFSGTAKPILSISGDTATVKIRGVLTDTPDIDAMIWGGGNTTYERINSALEAAESSKSVKSIVLDIDSPGGTVAGLFETLGAMENVTKPISARVRSQATSAAYAIAAQADSIEAVNRASSVGSIGVVTRMYTGGDVINITSSEAPNKRPDPKTEEGQAAIREELDAIHALFVETIAAGRGTTVENVNKTFGRGGVFLADEAMKRGMIDAIVSPNTTARAGGNSSKSEAKAMDLQTLKAQHPDVYAAAAAEGQATERDRVAAHLHAGQMSGLVDKAIKCAIEGTAMTLSAQTEYMMAAANKGDVAKRTEDENALASAADGAAPTTQEELLSDKKAVADEVLRMMGYVEGGQAHA